MINFGFVATHPDGNSDHSFGHLKITEEQYERIQAIFQEDNEPPRQIDLCAVCGGPIFDTDMYRFHSSTESDDEGEVVRLAHSRCP